MRDEEGFVWIGVHSGSRGLGHTSATRYLKAAGGKDGMNVPPAVIDEASELGQRYIAAMELAGRYAYAGREWVCERVRKIIGGSETDRVHNHHNYAWRERHGDRDLWVVRKGATPAFPGQRGFVGGSMGDDAVIIARDEAKLARACTALAENRVAPQQQVIPLAADVAERSAIEAAIDQSLARLGGPDLLITSAGICEPGRVERLPVEVFERTMQV